MDSSLRHGKKHREKALRLSTEVPKVEHWEFQALTLEAALWLIDFFHSIGLSAAAMIGPHTIYPGSFIRAFLKCGDMSGRILPAGIIARKRS